MPMYTCYPRRPDGVSPAFEARDFATDAEAAVFAGQLFADYPRANQVEVWQGKRLVMICPRTCAPRNVERWPRRRRAGRLT